MVAVDDEEDQGAPEPVGSFHPAVHHGIPVELPGQRREGRYGGGLKAQHPPVGCPAPRYPASLRGRYRCPACGDKVPLDGAFSAREVGYELADRAMEQVVWLARSVVSDVWFVVRLAWWWAFSRADDHDNEAGGVVTIEVDEATHEAWKRFQETVKEDA